MSALLCSHHLRIVVAENPTLGKFGSTQFRIVGNTDARVAKAASLFILGSNRLADPL